MHADDHGRRHSEEDVRDKQEVQTYRIGHVVFGCVQLDEADNPEDITATIRLTPIALPSHTSLFTWTQNP
ncbi:MAG TPA: hypothetical protein PLY87_23270 [Planctomycetaceae bacterium]|nr:hypothetical protein [Planctomycetaceae bacterium]